MRHELECKVRTQAANLDVGRVCDSSAEHLQVPTNYELELA